VRPIVSAHLNRFDVLVNPILDTNYTGGFGSLEFVPATRAAYNFNEKWAFAAEEYADLGPLRDLKPLREQSHQIWAVMDRKSSIVSIEVGVGVTAGADSLTLKLMLSRDLRHQ
jgi:hypothetical protein